MDSIILAYKDLSVIIFCFAILSFLISIIVKRNDIADVSWGIGFIIVSSYLLFRGVENQLAVIICCCVILWGLRLSIHIGIRNSKKSEDFRYKQWREEWGKAILWRSFLQVYCLQMFILLILAAPIITLAKADTPVSIYAYHIIFIATWSIGFLWEAIADYQLTQFKKSNTGKVLTTGLWRYSRHPNYFGELIMWWSLFFIVLPTEYGIYTIVCPVLLTFLLFKVSGVPMLEEKYANNEEYKNYIQRTAAIIPFIKF
ncbi:MAG: DUF1295 domain-containing protein [Fulvivirga sp.]